MTMTLRMDGPGRTSLPAALISKAGTKRSCAGTLWAASVRRQALNNRS